jgi:pimeloyl-ACP methyl ester carboxylesterase
MRSGYAAVNDLEMYFEVHGAGEPLLLLHGAMGTIESCFTELLPRLAARHEVIAAELQGHGHTADIERPLSYDQLADDAVALLRALDVTKADVVGYSLGGAVGLATAMRHPEMLRRLVFFGGATYRRDGLDPALLEEFDAAPPDLAGTVWHEAYRRVAPRPDEWSQLVAKVNALDRSFEGWSTDDVGAIRAPVLLLVGDADIARLEHVVEMFRLLGGGLDGDLVGIPDSHLGVLPGTSHTGILERVEWLESMILGFLGPP